MFPVYLNAEERGKLFELICELACCDGECTEEEKDLCRQKSRTPDRHEACRGKRYNRRVDTPLRLD